jgi:hypothetical protein
MWVERVLDPSRNFATTQPQKGPLSTEVRRLNKFTGYKDDQSCIDSTNVQ